jgi:D-alanyl-D-alanine carboxypeptidase (penicillin-binding protein 5/6)
MTCRELATLGMHVISKHSDMYPLFSTKRFEFNDYKTDWCREWGRTHTLNYNKLLFIMSGADGMKTGHTDEGGYGMVASSKVGGRRLIAVINGFKGKNHNALAEEVKKLLNHGYSTTTNRIFYHAGDKIAEIPVWYGRQETVTATVERTFAVTLKKNQPTTGLRVLARFDEPVAAPIKKGQKIGEIFAELDGRTIARAPLVAADKVNKTQFFGRVWKNISVIFGGRK